MNFTDDAGVPYNNTELSCQELAEHFVEFDWDHEDSVVFAESGDTVLRLECLTLTLVVEGIEVTYTCDWQPNAIIRSLRDFLDSNLDYLTEETIDLLEASING